MHSFYPPRLCVCLLSLACLACCGSVASGIPLQHKNLVPCDATTACTELTSLCTTCYSILADTVPKYGIVAASDTHVYRFSLCDGQTPFRVTLTTVYGNADLKIWDQPNIDLVPSYQSVAHLDPEQNLYIGSDLGIRTYTIAVYNSGLFGASYKLVVNTGLRQWDRGRTFVHTLNEGCSQYYTHTIDEQRGTPYMGVTPDQVQIYAEGRSTSASWPTAAANWQFELYSYYNELKRPEVISTLIPNATNGLVGTSRPGRGLGYTVNGARTLSGYPISNEFTLLSSNPEYKIGNYYTAVKLKAVRPSICSFYPQYSPLAAGICWPGAGLYNGLFVGWRSAVFISNCDPHVYFCCAM